MSTLGPALLAAALGSSPSCRLHDLGPDTSLWPLIESYESPDGRARQTNVFGPIVETSVDAESRTFALRPLVVATSNPGAGYEDVKFLWPLGRSRATPLESYVRFFPLYYDRRWLTGEGWQRSWAVLPFLFGGSTPTRGDYFAVFPFGGTVKEFFARDEITFVLFPAYMRTHTGETQSVNVLWPIVSVARGPGAGAVSILPFYGHRFREGAYERRYVLWPFVQWGREQLDTDESSTWFFVWPFYGKESSASSSKWIALWPFFSGGTNRRTGYSAYELPWPILTYERGKELDRFRIWPLFGWTRTPEIDSTFYLWPFVWDRHEHGPWTTARHFYVLPFLISIDRRQTGETDSSSYFKLWPLFFREREASGRTRFQMLTLAPLRLEGVEEVYGFLWSLYRRATEPDGSGWAETWLRSFVHRWGPGFEEYRLPLLWSHRSDAEGRVNHSFLLGLVQYESDPSGAGLRFFYLPRFPRW